MKRYSVKNIILVIFIVLLGFYFLSKNNQDVSVQNVSAKNKILAIAFNHDSGKLSEIRDSIGIEQAVTLNRLIEDAGYYYYADGKVLYGDVCRNIKVKWKKDALFTPKNREVTLNESC